MKMPEIEWLLEAKEGENIEFKRAEKAFEFEELVKYACALANRGGGYVALGITDKRPRQVVGTRAFEQPERTRKGLMDRLHLRIDFHLLDADGNRVLVFDIPPRPVGVPIQDKGIAWWREGDSLVELLLKHIRENAKTGSQMDEFYQVLPGLVRTQIQRLLREMKAQGQVHSHGMTRAARWYPGATGKDCSKHER